jgi:SAM-dependent methyltransferase
VTVLDVGARDGGFAFAAEKRGAARVVAYDLDPPDATGFATAKRLRESKVEYVQGSVYDLSPKLVGTFDIVLFFGVLDHLRYPLLALDRLWEVTDGYALIETHCLDHRVLLPGGGCPLSAIDPRLTDVALYQFHRKDEWHPGDVSNWFVPNRRAVEDGLWSAGFQPEFLATRDDRIAFKATKRPGMPEHRRHTCEEVTWQARPDGSVSPGSILPDKGPTQRLLGPNERGGAKDSGGVVARAETAPTRFTAAFARLREPKRQGAVSYPPGAEDRIVEALLRLDVDVRRYDIDVADYRRYATTARYPEAFPDYYPANRQEKCLEHYLAAKLLDLERHDIYVDIASEHSPAPDVYRKLFGVTAYRQDLAYPPGLRGDQIGGDAARMPVPDGFATKMALHCSFEHFEGNSDRAFIREANRVLRPGGALCVVPLYLFEAYVIQADPEVAVPAGVVFEDDATVYGAQGWGNRHARFYDAEHLAARVLDEARGMSLHIYRISNAGEVDPSCYVRFAMLIRKPVEGATSRA